MDLSETVLQFGGGNFLRAFVDLFLHEANGQGEEPGRAVVVQSTDSNRAAQINRQDGRYHVVVRGLESGREVDAATRVTSISRAVDARSDWGRVLEFARSPGLRWIVSNTTEAGYTLSADDGEPCGTPSSFPAKLLAVLMSRFEARLPGVTVLPCELVEPNGDRLKRLVNEQARIWRLGSDLTEWIHSEVRWANTLVDRIVSGRPDAHPLLDQDPLLTVAEPFALWVIEDEGRVPFRHRAIQPTSDVRPYVLRKVRILNGAHSGLVCRALPMGIQTVRQAVEHDEIGPWLRDLVSEEIVPTLRGEVEAPEAFSDSMMERFANPFLDHRLSDIALHHEEKVRVRLKPTYDRFVEMFGRPPTKLAVILKQYL